VKHFTTAFSRSRQITKKTTSSIILLFKNLIFSNCFAINFAPLLEATDENFVFFPFSVQFVRPKCFFPLLPSKKKSSVWIDNRIYWVALKLRMGKVNREAVKGTGNSFSQSNNASRNDNHVVKQKHWLNYSLSSIELMSAIDWLSRYDNPPCYLNREWSRVNTPRYWSKRWTLTERTVSTNFFLFTDHETKFFSSFFIFRSRRENTKKRKKNFYIYP
jgi:hypothetical protein